MAMCTPEIEMMWARPESRRSLWVWSVSHAPWPVIIATPSPCDAGLISSAMRRDNSHRAALIRKVRASRADGSGKVIASGRDSA